MRIEQQAPSRGHDVPPELAVVIPMYREASRIEPTLRDAIATLRSGSRDAEVILVDDGSPDRTVDAVAPFLADERDGRLIRVRLLRHEKNRGKGAAVRTGLADSSAPWRLIMDADNSTAVGEVEKLFRVADAKAGLIAGSRALASSDVDAKSHRKLAGRVFRGALWLIGVALLEDTQCGFKLYRGDVADAASRTGEEDRFAFDIEHLLTARAMGYEVKEVGVRWEHRDGGTVSVVRDGLTMLRSAVRIKRRMRSATRESLHEAARDAAAARAGETPALEVVVPRPLKVPGAPAGDGVR